MKSIAASIVLCLLAFGASAEHIVVLEVRHRPAEELAAALSPLLRQGEALSANGNQLIVRADTPGIERIQQALAQLDKPRRQVQIMVRRASAQSIEREALAARAIASNEQGLRVQSYATDSSVAAGDTGVTRVLVQEGSEALIDMASATPQMTSAAVDTCPSGTRVVAGVATRELHSGLLVVPRLSDTHVDLEITIQQERAQQDGIAIARSTNHVVGILGAWLPLEAVSTAATVSAGHTLKTREDEFNWWIRADEVR